MDATAADKTVLIARGRLKKARGWLDHPRRRVRPKSRRGISILGWVADHARLAYPANPEGAVRRCCCQFASELTEPELDEIVVTSEGSNKTWTPDQCAMVLGISFDDNLEIGFRFIGCDDDLNYDRRRKRDTDKGKQYSRTYRASKGASTKRGRPPLDLSEEEMVARRKAQAVDRKRAERLRKKAATSEDDVTLNSSGFLSKSMKSDELNVTQPLESGGGPQATPRQNEIGDSPVALEALPASIDMGDDGDVDGMIEINDALIWIPSQNGMERIMA
jgi:hypothetical protein